jgi:hypothetical protein
MWRASPAWRYLSGLGPGGSTPTEPPGCHFVHGGQGAQREEEAGTPGREKAAHAPGLDGRFPEGVRRQPQGAAISRPAARAAGVPTDVISALVSRVPISARCP